jgi:multiple sugar transport system substrate-binding protein
MTSYKYTRRSLVAGIVLAGAALLYGPAPGAAQEKIELTLHHAWPAHARFHEAVAKAFMEKHPNIDIKFRAPSPDYEEAVQTAVRQSIAKQLPDIQFSGLQKLHDLTARKIIVPLEPFLEREGDLKSLGYTDRLLALGQVDGKQYGMAFATSTPIIFYNAELVRRAGGNPEQLPSDWDSLIKLGGAIDKLEEQVDGMYYELGVDDWTTQALFLNFGAALMTPDAKNVAFDGPAGKAAVELYKRFHVDGGQKPVEQRAARQQFAAGTLGMYIASPANIRAFEEQVGSRFPLRTAVLPLANKKDGGVPTGGMAAVIMATDPAKQNAAWEYIKFGTGPEGQAIVAKMTGYMPANMKALEPQYLGEFYKQNPNWETSARQIDVARPWFAWPGENGVKIGRVLLDGMTRIAQGTATPEKALDEMARDTRALLPKR